MIGRFLCNFISDLSTGDLELSSVPLKFSVHGLLEVTIVSLSLLLLYHIPSSLSLSLSHTESFSVSRTLPSPLHLQRSYLQQAMEEAQSFRWIGKTDIEKITLGHVDGQNVVYWEDIEQVFPGVRYIKNGEVTVSIMRDANQIR